MLKTRLHGLRRIHDHFASYFLGGSDWNPRIAVSHNFLFCSLWTDISHHLTNLCSMSGHAPALHTKGRTIAAKWSSVTAKETTTEPVETTVRHSLAPSSQQTYISNVRGKGVSSHKFGVDFHRIWQLHWLHACLWRPSDFLRFTNPVPRAVVLLSPGLRLIHQHLVAKCNAKSLTTRFSTSNPA